MSPAYGPNSVAAGRLLDELDHLHPGAIAALAAAGGGSTGTRADDPTAAARAELRARLRDVAVAGGRLEHVRAIGDEVAAWAASTTHWLPAGVAATGDSTIEIAPRLAAAPVVLDAAYAVVLEDLLEDDDLDLLLAPWEEVVGSPFGEREPTGNVGSMAEGDDGAADERDHPGDPEGAAGP